MKKINRILKDLLIRIRVSEVLEPFSGLFEFVALFNSMIRWAYRDKSGILLNDFFTFSRNHKKRFQGFQKLVDQVVTRESALTYLEFGVASGESFRWWLANNSNTASVFHGFDTFEGLPENWGVFYAKGAMKFDLPDIKDTRAHFYKGLFQQTLVPFINNNDKRLASSRLVIHMDADLFSSTIFTLSQLYPYLKRGDVILFDEFNVPRHEYKAFKIFTESFHINLKLIYAVNNYYQTGFIVN